MSRQQLPTGNPKPWWSEYPIRDDFVDEWFTDPVDGSLYYAGDLARLHGLDIPEFLATVKLNFLVRNFGRTDV